uniref:Uncharacterized protein n=1 Tax=viral metagenome TaxID=1070528 RepID=A0A6C0D9H1_9ZZZZ
MVKRKNMRKTQKGAGYSFGQAVAPEAPYAQEVIGGPKLTPDCLAATRPGLASTLPGTGGLPGFAGGARNLANSEGISQAQAIGSPLMKGGRYTYDVGAGPLTGSAGPAMGSYPVVSRIGCEGGLVNTSPSGAQPNPTPLQNGGVGGVDSAYYIAPTAGYSNGASSWVGSTGAPSLVQIPFDARIANPACNKTGGGKRKMRKSRRSKRKGNRKSRKTRR